MRKSLVLALAVISACGSSSSNTPAADAPPATPDATTSVTLKPGDNVQAALIAAKAGQKILFTEGTYMFTEELTLSVAGVTLKGMGDRDKIILDFSKAAVGGHGISVTAGDFILDGVTIRDTKDDAVRVQGVDGDHPAKNVTIRNVKVYWTAGSTTDN